MPHTNVTYHHHHHPPQVEALRRQLEAHSHKSKGGGLSSSSSASSAFPAGGAVVQQDRVPRASKYAYGPPNDGGECGYVVRWWWSAAMCVCVCVCICCCFVCGGRNVWWRGMGMVMVWCGGVCVCACAYGPPNDGGCVCWVKWEGVTYVGVVVYVCMYICTHTMYMYYYTQCI